MRIMFGGAHRHQPLRYILGGDEPHPPWVPVPRATHILPGHVPRDDYDNDDGDNEDDDNDDADHEDV